ncbi:MAG: hypothetical protein AAF607_12340 [Pseudomonadota bacterium]
MTEIQFQISPFRDFDTFVGLEQGAPVMDYLLQDRISLRGYVPLWIGNYGDRNYGDSCINP